MWVNARHPARGRRMGPRRVPRAYDTGSPFLSAAPPLPRCEGTYPVQAPGYPRPKRPVAAHDSHREWGREVPLHLTAARFSQTRRECADAGLAPLLGHPAPAPMAISSGGGASPNVTLSAAQAAKPLHRKTGPPGRAMHSASTKASQRISLLFLFVFISLMFQSPFNCFSSPFTLNLRISVPCLIHVYPKNMSN